MITPFNNNARPADDIIDDCATIATILVMLNQWRERTLTTLSSPQMESHDAVRALKQDLASLDRMIEHTTNLLFVIRGVSRS
jgi:phytoene/squalene synthetase